MGELDVASVAPAAPQVMGVDYPLTRSLHPS
jgi:hypothetical protein